MDVGLATHSPGGLATGFSVHLDEVSVRTVRINVPSCLPPRVSEEAHEDSTSGSSA